MKIFTYGALLACLATPAAAIDGRDDYPYVRAWAMVAAHNKFQLEEELRLARYQKPPQTAVYRDQKEFYGWRLLKDLEGSIVHDGLVKLAEKKPRPYFGVPE
jgi:hypothetical protein